MADDRSSPPGQKRQRAKQACEPCRLRKRRCDGSLPCNMCTQFEYKCYFEKHPRKRSKIVEQNAQADGISYAKSDTPPPEDRPSVEEDVSDMRSMEANSGIAFTRLLGLRLDPSSGPKLFTFGWNLGKPSAGAAPSILPHVTPITELLTYDQFRTLAGLYFKHSHPLYGMIDKKLVLEQASLRWRHQEPCRVPDHLLAGVAAVGSLFSPDSFGGMIASLVEFQQLALERTSIMLPCTLMDVQSWTLRVIYLRATDHPHATHLASCAAIHLAESIGLHQESSSTTLHAATPHAQEDAELRRRTFWITRMLNTWVCFEYGRTRVMLRGITIGLPTPREGDFTAEYIDLYSISCCLEPEVSDKAGQWEDFLRRLEAFQSRHDGITLSRANLALCGYRRLRLANPNLSPEVVNRIIGMGLTGLECARRFAEKGHAWWHVANVPFQCVAVFLAMDVRESLSHIATAMRTLEYVVDRFGTPTMREAQKTARFLIQLSKKRKDEDSEVLGRSLARPPKRNPVRAPVNVPAAMANGIAPAPRNEQMTPQTVASSSDDWGLDVLNNSQFDWNFFLTADMPAFTDFTPDGTM